MYNPVGGRDFRSPAGIMAESKRLGTYLSLIYSYICTDWLITRNKKRRSVESRHIGMIRRNLAFVPDLMRNWTGWSNFPKRDLWGETEKGMILFTV